MKRIVMICLFFILMLDAQAQFEVATNGNIFIGVFTSSQMSSTSYKWNINTYGGLNWNFRYPGGTTRTFKIDLESDSASLSYSTGEIGFYQPDDSYNRVICYDVFIRFPFNPQMNNTSSPWVTSMRSETAIQAASGINVSEALRQTASAIGRMQGQLVSGIHPTLSSPRRTSVPFGANSYVLVTTLDGTPVSKQVVVNFTSVDKTGLQAGTYCSTLFVEGQPVESENFVVMDF